MVMTAKRKKNFWRLKRLKVDSLPLNKKILKILKMGIIYINMYGNLQVYTIFSNKLKIFSVSGQTFSRYLSNNNFLIENGN